MVDLYAECPKHGVLTVDLGFELPVGVTLEMPGGVQINCGFCGRLVPLLDFRYRERFGDSTVITASSPLGAQQMFRLRSAIEAAKRALEAGSPDLPRRTQTLEDILTDVIPESAPILAAAKQTLAQKAKAGFAKDPAGWTSVLIALVTIIITGALSLPTVQQAIDEFLLGGDPPPSSSEPTTPSEAPQQHGPERTVTGPEKGDPPPPPSATKEAG